jgi:TrmH family RNA methyltransferase
MVDAASPLKPLTRSQGTLIRHLLHDKETRIHERAFVIEGAKLCLDLIRRYPQAVISLTLSCRYLQAENEAERRIRSKLAVPQFFSSNAVFEKLSDVEAPQGVLAIVGHPQWDEAKILGQSRVLGIYGDQLRDPANVGAIIRTAAALNLTGVWLSCDSADHFSSKVIRATAGAVLALPIFRVQDIRTFSQQKCSIFSALVPSPGTIPLRSIRKIPRRLMIAVGNEGRGLSPDLVKASDVRFSIPLTRGIESLNVAATVAISAFYFSDLATEP